MGLYRIVLRPFLFALEAERAHRVTLAACETFGHNALVQRALARRFALEYPQLAIDIAGLHFKTPVGLAAGFDKNGVAVAVTSRLGFGFVEVGSVSLHPSAGNVGRPRVWRLTADNGLRVHYGCPNDGVQAIANRLSGYDHRVPLGINLVETNTGHIASAEHAADELATLIGRCANLADYLVLNLSCPNMPGGKGLFDMSAQLQNLLQIGRAHV